MQDIEIRAYDPKAKDYYCALLSVFFENSPQGIYSAHFISSLGDECDVLGKDLIFELYSRVKDKNGKKIFEGDKVKDEFGLIKVVDYDNGAFILKDHSVFYWLHEYVKFYVPGVCNLEVVGTIHDKE